MKYMITLLLVLGFFSPTFAEASTPKDKTAPTATSIHIESSNADPAKAKAGDTVTLSFTTSETATPIVLVETKSLFVEVNNTAGNDWDASYVVNAKDRTGKVDYVLVLVDAAGNTSICSSVKVFFLKHCPTTDGSSVTIYKEDVPPPPTPDTTAPVIEPHADVFATTTGTSAEVIYTPPAATDNVDGSVAVSCVPASGSTFALGTTTVACSAQDAAGNTAQSSFLVIVEQEVPPPPPEPEEYVMASQPDDSFLCQFSWRLCYSDDPNFSTPTVVIDLGQGTNMGTGGLQTITIARDENDPNTALQLWLLSLRCFTDAAYSVPCTDWVAPTAANDNRTDLVKEFAADTSDNKYWSADFTDPVRERNFDGSSPVVFNPAYYYQLVIDDVNWEVGAYGTQTEPYWVIRGITQ